MKKALSKNRLVAFVVMDKVIAEDLALEIVPKSTRSSIDAELMAQRNQLPIEKLPTLIPRFGFVRSAAEKNFEEVPLIMEMSVDKMVVQLQDFLAERCKEHHQDQDQDARGIEIDADGVQLPF